MHQFVSDMVKTIGQGRKTWKDGSILTSTITEATTVGNLLKDLKRYEKKHWSDCVVAWTADGRTFGVLGTREDEDGDIQIMVEEIEEILEGILPVTDVIASLENTGKEKRVYLAGDGLYFAIDSDGSIFTKCEDDDVIGCYVTVLGKYEEEPAEESVLRKKCNNGEVIALAVLTLLGLAGLVNNIYGLVIKSGSALWEYILWIVTSSIVVAVCGLALYYSCNEQYNNEQKKR